MWIFNRWSNRAADQEAVFIDITKAVKYRTNFTCLSNMMILKQEKESKRNFLLFFVYLNIISV